MVQLLNQEATKNQTASYADFLIPNPKNSYDRLGELKMPVLIMNGDNDLLVKTSLSWEMAARIPNAQLIIYPHAGHGFLYQYAELVAHNVNMFLNGSGEGAQVAKL
jgi:pimeloyl-ACP methyl ester carboxylesterase